MDSTPTANRLQILSYNAMKIPRMNKNVQSKLKIFAKYGGIYQGIMPVHPAFSSFSADFHPFGKNPIDGAGKMRYSIEVTFEGWVPIPERSLLWPLRLMKPQRLNASTLDFLAAAMQGNLPDQRPNRTGPLHCIRLQGHDDGPRLQGHGNPSSWPRTDYRYTWP